ncbi:MULTISPECIES: DUF805 domain-containing protein [Bacillus]|uniref:DUF805 domain-containing protein n=1 Tax=Bacillus TaxID=1386 RepID=UPI00041681A2|nr:MULTISPECIES: DUF805 domain-containing protein [Bacillus]QHZ45963.1 DUF805 domain-containing protein [Bacillus sp. NSP9.1]WFA06151.1 DUF805 domain-containing protein [Bacillus sp. HSf4]
MQWYWKCLKNYADFEGRARRKEYWMFCLFNALICFTLFILSIIIVGILTAGITTAAGFDGYQVGYVAGYGGGMLGYILIILYQLAVLVPSLAVGVRRLHDIGKSGWWIFIGFIPLVGAIILLIFYCQDSEKNDNQYGVNPKVS